MNPEEIDSILLRLQAGVDLAMQRAKAWSKYMKEITTYIEKKTQLGKYSASDKTRIVKNNCVRYFIFFLMKFFSAMHCCSSQFLSSVCDIGCCRYMMFPGL